jgi:hypothetical protein
MARELSIYEGTLDGRNGLTCLGRITNVDADARRCRVKTIGLKGATDDLDLYNVQWVSLTAHDQGDECTFIPRAGQYGVVLFINSEPYITGFFSTLPAEPGVVNSNKVKLKPGDWIVKTIGENRIIVRGGGSIEVESSKMCHTYWLPARNLISSVCKEYELECDGGFFFWTRDKKTDATKLEFFAYNSLKPTNACSVQMGTGVGGELLRVIAGSCDGKPDIQNSVFKLLVQPTGDTTLDVGNGKATLSIKGATGDTSLVTKGKLTITTTGDAALTSAGALKQVGKTASVEGTTSAQLKSNKVAIGNSGTELLDQIVTALKAIGMLTPPTAVGPTAPFQSAPQWSQVQAAIGKIESIKGSIS